MRILLAVLVIGGVCRASDGDSPATSAEWKVPHWEPILTSPEALPQRYGHVQGICVTSNAIYYSMSDGYCKTDWRGRVLKKKLMFKNDYHVGDLCHHKGRIYTTKRTRCRSNATSRNPNCRRTGGRRCVSPSRRATATATAAFH